MSRKWLQVLELLLDNQELQSKSSTWNQGFQISKSVAEMIQEIAVRVRLSQVSSDGFELEFSGSSEPELKSFRAESSRAGAF